MVKEASHKETYIKYLISNRFPYLKKRLNYLKTKPKEMEKAVKADLNYVAENEVVYIFEEPEQDNTEDKNEN